MQDGMSTMNLLKAGQRVKNMALKIDQLKQVAQKFEAELRQAFADEEPKNDIPATKGIRVIDTHITHLPKNHQQPAKCMSIDLNGITVALIKPDGTKWEVAQTVHVPYAINGREIGFLSSQVSATVFANTSCEALKRFIHLIDPEGKESCHEIIMMSYFFITKKSRGCDFFHLQEVINPQITAHDSLCNVNLLYLLRVNFEEKNIPVVIKNTLSHSAARLLGAAISPKIDEPKCCVAMHIDEHIQASIVVPDLDFPQFEGSILDVDLASFNGNKALPESYSIDLGLPYNVVDFQIKTRLSYGSKPYFRDLEFQTSSMFLAELTRLAIIRVFEKHAPKLAWVQDSLSLNLLLDILGDDLELTRTTQIVQSIWECDDREKIQLIRKVVLTMLSRSAALVAVVITKLAKQTRKLQPALGGVSILLSGVLGTNPVYVGLIQHFLNKLHDRDMSSLIHFHACKKETALMGAAQYYQSL